MHFFFPLSLTLLSRPRGRRNAFPFPPSFLHPDFKSFACLLRVPPSVKITQAFLSCRHSIIHTFQQQNIEASLGLDPRCAAHLLHVPSSPTALALSLAEACGITKGQFCHSIPRNCWAKRTL